jgi:SAM-dependent methyltransferase
MAIETASLNSEALGLLGLQPSDRLLEVGFGHGRTIRLAATQVPQGFVAGVDVSDDMVRMAQRRCLDLAGKGLVELIVGDSRRLPYADISFDKVYASTRSISGRSRSKISAKCFECLDSEADWYSGFVQSPTRGRPLIFPETVYSFYSIDEVSTLLQSAGFEKSSIRNAGTSPGEMFLAVARRPQ